MYCCWRSDFRVKVKRDVDEMFNSHVVSGSFYFEDDTNDYFFEKEDDGKTFVGWRSKTERGDIFPPYLVYDNDDEAKAAIWRGRKSINQFLRR